TAINWHKASSRCPAARGRFRRPARRNAFRRLPNHPPAAWQGRQRRFEFSGLLAYSWREPPTAGRPVPFRSLLGEPMDNPFPIVGVGASAGGVEALEYLFKAMPPEPGMAFVIITHLAPGRESMLPEILARDTRMPVLIAEHEQAVRPNHVYVAPADAASASRRGGWASAPSAMAASAPRSIRSSPRWPRTRASTPSASCSRAPAATA